jgi:hypothetical protein
MNGIKGYLTGLGTGIGLVIIGNFVEKLASNFMADPNFIYFFVFPYVIPIAIIGISLFYYKKNKKFVKGLIGGLCTTMVLFALMLLVIGLSMAFAL